ncbi:hypothetical protein Lal_00025036 [Lupinus albus]|nr:hypothetical protein Lal_00025036 [Lupinus albus]
MAVQQAEVMWPTLVASKKLNKPLGSRNFLEDYEGYAEQPLLGITSDDQSSLSTEVFVSTWNVGGIAPDEGLNIKDLLDTCNQFCDIYVLGICDLSHKTNIYKEKEKGIRYQAFSFSLLQKNIRSTLVLSEFPSSGANGKPSGSSNRNILQPTYLGAFGMANQGMRFLLHYETNWGFLRSGLGLFH